MKSQTVRTLMVVIAKERSVISIRMVRPKMSGSLWDRKKAMVASTTTMKVVNLMPDAVEALPPPINISTSKAPRPKLFQTSKSAVP